MPTLVPPGFDQDPDLAHLLGQVSELLEAQKFEEAIPLMTRAVEQMPDNGPLLANLGGLYIETGRYSEAVPLLRRAAALNPQIAVVHWRLGTALQMAGDHLGAIESLEAAVQIRPNLADAHVRLALLYRQQGRGIEAKEQYRIAAQYSNEPGRKQFLEAEALLGERREDEAEELLRSAIELQPDLPGAHGVLGQLLFGMGRFDEAARHFEAEIDVSPDASLAYYDLVRCRKITSADEAFLQRIDTALETPDLGDLNRAVMLLARGKILDDLGRYEAAMKSLDEAAMLRSRAFAIDVDAFEAKVDRIISLFSAETIARCTSRNDDRTPVLIVGMPRSGTTLVEQIISSHSQAAGGGELSFWSRQLDAVLDTGVDVLTADFSRSRASEYLDALRTISESAIRLTDKNPFNFLALGLIHIVFPNAAIVHCRRDPVDTALSIHQTHFTRSTGMPTGGEELVRYFRAYRRLMAHWHSVLPQGRILEVIYENLTASPHAEILRLISHLGLDWDPACLTPHINSTLVRTPSGWQVRQSINTGSVGRWRHYEQWLGPLAGLLQRPGTSAS